MARNKNNTQDDKKPIKSEEEKRNLRHNVLMFAITVFCCACFIVVGILASINFNKKDTEQETITNNANYSKLNLKQQDGTYLIESYKDLQLLSEYVNRGDEDTNNPDRLLSEASFKLINDIVCLNNFVPIGTQDYPFKGNFLGNGKTISNLLINCNQDYIGLFGVTDGATITCLGISSGEIKSDNNSNFSSAGALVGLAKNTSILNCYNWAEVANEGNIAGGIVGTSVGTCEIKQCYNTGEVSSKFFAGGLVGKTNNLDNITISDCYNIGLIKSANADGIIYGSEKFSSNRLYSFYSCGANSYVCKRSILNMSGIDALTGEEKMNSLLGYVSKENTEDILFFPQLACFVDQNSDNYFKINKYITKTIVCNFVGNSLVDSVYFVDNLATNPQIVVANKQINDQGQTIFTAEFDVVYGEKSQISASIYYTDNIYNFAYGNNAKAEVTTSSTTATSTIGCETIVTRPIIEDGFLITELHNVSLEPSAHIDAQSAVVAGDFSTSDKIVVHGGSLNIKAKADNGYVLPENIWESSIGTILDPTIAETKIVNITESGNVVTFQPDLMNYEIKYNLLGGEALDESAFTQSYTIEDLVMFPSSEQLTNGNSIFLGWTTTTKPAGSGLIYDSNNFCIGIKSGTYNGDLNLVANWVQVTVPSLIEKQYGFSAEELFINANCNSTGEQTYDYNYSWYKKGNIDEKMVDGAVLTFSTKFNVGTYEYYCSVEVLDKVTGTTIAVFKSSNVTLMVLPKPIELKRLDKNTFTYDGLVKNPVIELRGLLESDEVYLTYSDESIYSAVEPGSYLLEVNGLGGKDASNYTIAPETAITFGWNIYRTSLNLTTIESIEDQIYSGSPIIPNIIAKFNNAEYCGVQPRINEDYTIKFSYGTDNINVGKVIGNIYATAQSKYFVGSQTFEFNIVPDTDAEIIVNGNFEKYYSSSQITFLPTSVYIQDVLQEDYEITNNTATELGEYKLIICITGGNYNGAAAEIGYKIICPEVSLLDYNNEEVDTVYVKYETNEIFADNLATSLAILLVPEPREGYSFIGYFTKDNEQITDNNCNIIESLNITEPQQWIQKWQAKSYNLCLISYTNGTINSIGGNVFCNQKDNGGVVEYNSYVNLFAERNFSYIFDGWYLDSSLTKRISSENDFDYLYLFSEDITIYASFKTAEYKIKIDANGGEIEEFEARYYPSQTDSIIISLPSIPTKQGHTFLGYLINCDSAQLDSSNLTLTVFAGTEEDIQLSAIWAPVIIKVNFETSENEKIVGKDQLYIKYGTSTWYETASCLAETTTPYVLKTSTKLNISFCGWALYGNKVIDQNGNIITDVANVTDENGNIICTEDITLLPIFVETPKTFDIYYLGYNSGSLTYLTSYNYDLNNQTIITLPQLTADGYSLIDFIVTQSEDDKARLIIKDGFLIIPPDFYGNITLDSVWQKVN